MEYLEDSGYKAKLLLDSMSPDGVRLTTMEVTFPRFILAEFNTHRMFSRNSASSRAIPIEKQIKRIKENPCGPLFWGKNQKGMQANHELNDDEKWKANFIWFRARDKAIEYATLLSELGAHKQVTNRILEPFMWHTVLVTATEWSNFFGLRCHPDAQPEFRKIASMMKTLYDSNVPKVCAPFGYWHMPLVYNNAGEMLFNEDNEQASKLSQDFGLPWIEILKRVSAGRCARVSYLTHDGKRDLAADLDLCNKLHSSGHMSPLEHVATPFDNECTQFDEYDTQEEDKALKRAGTWSGNFRGWRQFRSEIKSQSDFSKKDIV